MTTAFVPLDTAAVAAGADAVAAAIAGTGTEIIRNGSRGMCWAEPTMEVEHDGTRLAFGNVAASDVPSIFQQHERHAKCLGEVSGIDYLQRQTRAVFDRAGTSHPLELPNTTVLAECLGRDPESLIAEIEGSGLRGRGGAGFPAHIKWRTVFDTPGEQKYIVCNADEGDSGTFADRILMEGDPYRLIEGMTIAGLATGATKGYVYLRSRIPHCRRHLPSRLGQRLRGGLARPGTSWAAARPSTSSSSSAPVPTSAARRPRSSKASRESVARSASNPLFPPSAACSAPRPWCTTSSPSPPFRRS